MSILVLGAPPGDSPWALRATTVLQGNQSALRATTASQGKPASAEGHHSLAGESASAVQVPSSGHPPLCGVPLACSWWQQAVH